MDPVWKYDEYSTWSRWLAKDFTRPELEKKLIRLGGELSKASASHLRAVNKTTSMSGNSQSRAHSRNVVAGLGEERMAIENALELHDFYPNQCKQ